MKIWLYKMGWIDSEGDIRYDEIVIDVLVTVFACAGIVLAYYIVT